MQLVVDSPLALGALLLSLASGQLAEHLETWPDGTERERYEFVPGSDGGRVRHGDYESFFESGQQESKGTYEDGAREGSSWWSSGGSVRATSRRRKVTPKRSACTAS
jgi:hypothetical protein